MNVQWQRNDYDCGVFAIAYATELAHGGDPALYNWDCTSMWSHLVNCLEQRKLDSFPKSEKRKIYCVCRMPNNKKRGMIQCGSCKKWYHFDCISGGEINVECRWLLCQKCEDWLKSLEQ